MVQLLSAPATNSGRPCGVWVSPGPQSSLSRGREWDGDLRPLRCHRSPRVCAPAEARGGLSARPSGHPAFCSVRCRPGAAVKGGGWPHLVTLSTIEGDSAMLLRSCSKEWSSFYGRTSLLSVQTLRLWERSHGAQETVSRLPALPRGPEEGRPAQGQCRGSESQVSRLAPSIPEQGQPWRSLARGGQRRAPRTRRNK